VNEHGIGLLFDVKRFALHDGPGIRTTVFLKGCPLSCVWCHNPESQVACPELMHWQERCVGCGACIGACPIGALSLAGERAEVDRDRCTACAECVTACSEGALEVAGEPWSVRRLLDEIEKDVLFYDESGGGVTLSGGEPLTQGPFVEAVLKQCRERRIHTAVDTCGHAEWADLERIAAVTDIFLYDLKQMDDERHRELTGVSNERILGNLRRLDGERRAIRIRYPVIPGENDSDEDISALGRFVADLESIESIQLLPFHRGGEPKRERLGRPDRAAIGRGDATCAAERAKRLLCAILDVPVQIGG